MPQPTDTEIAFGMLEVHYRKIPGPIAPTFVEEWRKGLTKRGREIIAENGHIDPVIFFVSDDPDDPSALLEGFIPLDEIMSRPHGKDILAQIMPKIFGELKAFAACQLTESWTCFEPESLKDYEAGKFENLGEAPGAMEVLLVTLQTKSNTGLWMYNINRNEDGSISSVDAEQVEGTGGVHEDASDVAVTGRFTGWIEDDGKEAN